MAMLACSKSTFPGVLQSHLHIVAINPSIWFMLVVLVITVQSTPLSTGPQTLTKNTPATQKPQKREIIVYLTPNQIKALQEGKGYINSQLIDQVETFEENQEQSEQAQQEQEELFQLRSLEEDSEASEEEKNEVPSSIPVEKPNSEEVEEEPQLAWVYRSSQNGNLVPISADNYANLRFNSEPEEQTEENQTEAKEGEEETEEDQPEAQPESQSEAEPEAPQQQVFRLVAYEAATEKSISTTTKAPQEDPLRERWLRLLELNRSQLRKASSPQDNVTTTAEQPQADPETNLIKLRFLVRNNNQKQTVKKQDKRRKNLLQKQKSLIQAEALVQNAPTQSRKEGTITKQNQPRLIQISKPSSVQATKTKKAGANKPAVAAPAEYDKRVFPLKKTSVPAENASVTKRRGPVSRKPKRLTIFRHVWEK